MGFYVLVYFSTKFVERNAYNFIAVQSVKIFALHL